MAITTVTEVIAGGQSLQTAKKSKDDVEAFASNNSNLLNLHSACLLVLTCIYNVQLYRLIYFLKQVAILKMKLLVFKNVTLFMQ